MQGSGVTQYDANRRGGDGIRDARNGLNIVTVGTDRYVELGGLLIHDTEIHSLVTGLYKLGLLDTSFYVRGSNGSNPVLGAGSRMAYIPAQEVLYLGNASGTQLDNMSNVIRCIAVVRNMILNNGSLGDITVESLIAGHGGSFGRVQYSVLASVESTGQVVDSLANLDSSQLVNITQSIVRVQSSTNASVSQSIGIIISSDSVAVQYSFIITRDAALGIATITESYYHNTSTTNPKAAVTLIESFFHGKASVAINGTRCFYFLTQYSGPALTEVDTVRFQKAALVPGLKLNTGDPMASIATETMVGILNLGAGTATKPLLQLTPGNSTTPSINQVQYNALSLIIRNGVTGSTAASIRTSRIIVLNTDPVTLTLYAGGTIYHCTVCRNITVNHAVLNQNPSNDTIRIKDGQGNAGASSITITPASGLINGAATYVINTNYGSVEIYSDGTNMFTI